MAFTMNCSASLQSFVLFWLFVLPSFANVIGDKPVLPSIEKADQSSVPDWQDILV